MIHLDTNYLILAISPGTAEARQLANLLSAGEQANVSVVAWSEFICGPLTPSHRRAAQLLLPRPEPLTLQDAELAAELFNFGGRRRGSLLDCFIAATCLRIDAPLATNDAAHFQRFVPRGLKLITP